MNTLRRKHDDLNIADDLTAYSEGEPFTGIAYDTAPSGQLLSEIEYRQGIQTGYGREWYPSGRLRTEESFRNGSKHGLSREWSENGQLVSEIFYEYSMPVREKHWNEAGQLIYENVMDESHPNYSLLEQFRKIGFG